MTTRQFDLIIFGASGFVGYYAIRDLVQSIQQKPYEYSTVKWAVAGRRIDKLEEALSELSDELQTDLSQVPKIFADVSDAASISAMVSSTSVLINCVGPYLQFGRAVVDACIQWKTHHLDVSAELQYIEGTQVECHKDALEAGSIIVSACGWASVISEMGVALARKHFNGTLHSVETFVDLKPGKHGYTIHFGSFDSIMYLFVNALDLLPIRRRLYSEILTTKLPKSRIRQWPWLLRQPLFNDAKGISVVFPAPDPSTIGRTQHYNYQHFNERPIQYHSYYRLRMMKVFLGWPIPLFMWCKCGRGLLKRHIGALTCGLITKKGPSRQQVTDARFTLRLIARGWTESVETGQVEPKGKLNKKMILKITGGDPAYVVTACCLVQAGLTIISDRDKMPRGGVMTPGSAFRDTNLWERLQSRGIKYDILMQ